MKYVLHNKSLVPKCDAKISIFDRGVTLGSGLFETMMIINGSIRNGSYHWSRLESSCKMLEIKLPFNKTDFFEMIYTLSKKNRCEKMIACARLTITEGESERGILPPDNVSSNFFITMSPIPEFKKSMSVIIVKTIRNEQSISSRIKNISYLDNIIAKKEAFSLGYDEAILKNSKNNISEGAVSNIFIVKTDNSIVTPFVSDGALPGTMRQMLLSESYSNFKIEEDIISESDIHYAKEIFLTNALMGIVPINKVGSIFQNDTFTVTNELKKFHKL